MRSSVVLPQPDGPRNTISSPRAACSAMSFSASNLPKLLWMPSSVRKASPSAPTYFGLGLGRVALLPLGDHFIMRLARCEEIVLEEALVVVRGKQHGKGCRRRRRCRDRRVVFRGDFHRVLAREPVREALRRLDMRRALEDGDGPQVPEHIAGGNDHLDRATRGLDRLRGAVERNAHRYLARRHALARRVRAQRVARHVVVEAVHEFPARRGPEDLEPACDEKGAYPGRLRIGRRDLALVHGLDHVTPCRGPGDILLLGLGRIEADDRSPAPMPHQYVGGWRGSRKRGAMATRFDGA